MLASREPSNTLLPRGRTGGQFLMFAVLAILVLAIHAPYLKLPYFWDELGQFVPAALDLYHDGALVPHSTTPNAHPPGVMAYLAMVWRIFGYSIPITRAAMLLLASLTIFAAYLLALELCPGLGRTPALVAPLLLLADPLFYTQSMMAQLDMPAMLFTVLALLLFLKERHAAAAVTCMALVLVKETGALLPLIFFVALMLRPVQLKYASYYLASFAILALWFILLWRTTGYIFGDPGFTHYNIGYALNPLRAAVSLIRRIYYVFIADFRWIGSVAIAVAWNRTRLYLSPQWKLIGIFFAAHIVLVSVLGGAALERYLLPAVPIFYIAAAGAFSTLKPVWRNAGVAATAAGLLLGLFLNPPFTFPYEDNLAMVDFVELHRSAARFLEMNYPSGNIYSAWPLTGALRDPAFGYVSQPLRTRETSDLHYSTLNALDPGAVDVLVLYSRTWEPPWSVVQWPAVHDFLHRLYQYERQMDSGEVRRHFGLTVVRRWDQRGQWIEVYAR